jgi:ribosome-associated protein
MTTEALVNELKFSTARSAGSGGQHVNKTETKVELIFDVQNSEALTDKEKGIILEKLASRISKNNVLRMSCQTERSQVWNKKIVIQKFLNAIKKALTPESERIPTAIPKSVQENRLKEKRLNADVKEMRKRIIL